MWYIYKNKHTHTSYNYTDSSCIHNMILQKVLRHYCWMVSSLAIVKIMVNINKWPNFIEHEFSSVNVHVLWFCVIYTLFITTRFIVKVCFPHKSYAGFFWISFTTHSVVIIQHVIVKWKSHLFAYGNELTKWIYYIK